MDSARILNEIRLLILVAPPILFSITFHEMAHGWMAYKLGDPTAKSQGRLSFNPLKHLDPIGTIVLFLTKTIGWAKPVPVDPRYFKNPRRDMMWVGLAGPVANFILAIISAIILRFLPAIFAIPALSHILTPTIVNPILVMTFLSVQINIGLGVFNLIPIPPLDGSRILAGIVPVDWAIYIYKLERYGFIIVLLLVFTGVTNHIIIPIITFLNHLLLGPMAGRF